MRFIRRRLGETRLRLHEESEIPIYLFISVGDRFLPPAFYIFEEYEFDDGAEFIVEMLCKVIFKLYDLNSLSYMEYIEAIKTLKGIFKKLKQSSNFRTEDAYYKDGRLVIHEFKDLEIYIGWIDIYNYVEIENHGVSELRKSRVKIEPLSKQELSDLLRRVYKYFEVII